MIDTLIIGSGVAAAALAQKLLEHNPTASIVILEAGTKVKMQDAAIWHDFVATGRLPYTKFYDKKFPQKDYPGENVDAGKTSVTLDGARVISYGGTTIHWGGWAFRLKPEDFKMKSNSGKGIDWPFDYAVLEPYYQKAEEYLGVAGDSNDKIVPRSGNYPFPAYPYTWQDKPIMQAFDKLKISYSHLPIARRGVSATASKHAPCQTTGTCKYCPFGARYSANNYLDDMLSWSGYTRFEVRLGCVVLELVMDTKDHVTGVRYLDKSDGEKKTVEARRIVVAAGTFESTKLLQRSGGKFWTHGVGNDYRHLGAYLVTHPLVMFKARFDKQSDLNLQPEMNFPTLVSRNFDTPEEQKNGGKYILINPASSPKVDLNELMRKGLSRDKIREEIKNRVTIEVHAMLEVYPRATNVIGFTVDKPNGFGLTQTSVDYSEDKEFTERVTQVQAKVYDLLTEMKATPTGPPSVSWRADHAAGTTRMGKDEGEGVTDSNLKVFGVRNLYVCSNSVMPNIGAVNPTLTLTALALKLGDHLAAIDGTTVAAGEELHDLA